MHSLSHCYGLLTALVLLNSVARWCNAKQFLQKLCNFTCLCAWASEGSFPGRTLVDFSKSFSRGAKSGEICILPHSKLRKEPFLLKFSNFWIHSDTHALVSKKVHATPSKLSCNFKRFNTILNSEIVLNLIGKIKYLTDQFQLCFFFTLVTLNCRIYFYIGNIIGILTADNLLVAAYALSCLCVPVSSEISGFMPYAHAQSDVLHIKYAEKTDD